MAKNPGNSLPLLRLFALLLLAGCLSQAPNAPEPAPGASSGVASSGSGRYRVVISKSGYSLTLFRDDRAVKTFHAVFGKGYSDGDKVSLGDKRTPEGDFYICTMHPSKRFYKFLGLSYPGLKHAEEGLRFGMISQGEFLMIKKALEEGQQPPWDTRLGGAVGIHGRMTAPADGARTPGTENWTDGCIALGNSDMDELFSVVSLGTPVTILP
jgi:murein L,D-transpeptidase YafK